MSPLQFSLFFAALLVAYILVHVRMVRFEKYLREIGGIKTLNERLNALSAGLERLRLDRVEELLGQLHEDLETVRKATDRVERAVGRGSGAAPGAGSGLDRSPAERIQSVVETRLLDLGYRNLRLLTDLSGVVLEEQLEVLVECERDHMPHKGRVTTKNGAIIDVTIQNAAQSFP
jgi:hypothetical protein